MAGKKMKDWNSFGGHRAISERKRVSRRAARGYSFLEMVVVVAIILVLVAIATPNYLHARGAARTASASASLQTFNTACIAYQTLYGTFPPKLASLGPAATGALPSRDAANLVDSSLAGGYRDGYKFTYTPGVLSADGSILSYTIVAEPGGAEAGNAQVLCASSTAPQAKACVTDLQPTLGFTGKTPQ